MRRSLSLIALCTALSACGMPPSEIVDSDPGSTITTTSAGRPTAVAFDRSLQDSIAPPMNPTDQPDDSTDQPDDSTDPPVDSTDQPTPIGTFYVEGRFLYDPCGNKVILRGVNKMNIWTDLTGSRSFAEIAKTGANTVRIVWNTSGTAAGLDTVITSAVSNRLLPIVELHDATGDWSMLQSLVDYWVRSDVVAVINKHESALLVNIGNEVGNGTVTADQFRTGYTLAVTRLRSAGINVPLVIDSIQWFRRTGSLFCSRIHCTT